MKLIDGVYLGVYTIFFATVFMLLGAAVVKAL